MSKTDSHMVGCKLKRCEVALKKKRRQAAALQKSAWLRRLRPKLPRDFATIERRATIEARDSEVRLDADRETDGDGQGSGLSGEAESQFAGLRFARLAAAE